MKFRIITILLFILPYTTLAQQVIQEAKPMTEEQKRVQAVREELRKLEDDYSKSKAQHEKNTQGLFPNSFGLNVIDKKKLLQKVKDNQAVLYSIQERSLKEKAREIDRLSSSIGGTFSYGSALQRRIDKLNENIKQINNTLNGIKKDEGEKKTEEMIQNIELLKLDKEISSLDDLLANSKVSAPKKSKSLDDFLTEKGKTSKSKTNSGNSLDAMLSSSSNKKTNKSSSLDAMLSSSGKNTESNSLDNLMTTASNDTQFKIDYKNGLRGVINSQGKILIPYKDWEIVEYKYGIAKVRKKLETKTCSWSYTAYSEGFVDAHGMFIDGFEVTFSSYSNSSYKPLTIYMNTGKTPAEKEANDRIYERRKEREKKEEEIKRKQCQVEINNWKRSMISKYK